MNLVWEHILPALEREAAAGGQSEATSSLRRKLASLSLPPQAGDATRPLAAQVSGKRYVFPGQRRQARVRWPSSSARTEP